MKRLNHDLSPVPPEVADKECIGDILLKWGKLTQANISRIALLQEKQQLRFGEIAKQEGLISEEDIHRVLAYQFEHLYLSSGENNLSPELVAAYQTPSPTLDILRMVRSELMHNWFGHGHKMLAVAGINRGDGASIMAANLAVVLSQLDGNTLLIDGNMRRPRQHSVFGIDRRLGLADILIGRANVDTICSINGLKNLSLLPAGTVPPNPQELLSRRSFAVLIAALTSGFDRIVIDLPACTEASDVFDIAIHAGGMLLVARRHHTKTADLDFVQGCLGGSSTMLLGTLLLDF